MEANVLAAPPPPPGDFETTATPSASPTAKPNPTSSASLLATSPSATLLPPGFLSYGSFPKVRSLLDTARRRGTTPDSLFVDIVLEHFHVLLCADLLPASSPLLQASPLWITVTAASSPPLHWCLCLMHYCFGWVLGLIISGFAKSSSASSLPLSPRLQS